MIDVNEKDAWLNDAFTVIHRVDYKLWKEMQISDWKVSAGPLPYRLPASAGDVDNSFGQSWVGESWLNRSAIERNARSLRVWAADLAATVLAHEFEHATETADEHGARAAAASFARQLGNDTITAMAEAVSPEPAAPAPAPVINVADDLSKALWSSYVTGAISGGSDSGGIFAAEIVKILTQKVSSVYPPPA